MQQLTITGNLGKDAELRQTQQGDDVCSFSVGVKQGFGDRASTNWYRCSVWGKRGKTLHPYLLKGVKVAVSGELSVGEYQGKTQLDVRVNEVDLMSRGEARQGSGDYSKADAYKGNGLHDFDDSDPVPF